jgi:hypothetical protein
VRVLYYIAVLLASVLSPVAAQQFQNVSSGPLPPTQCVSTAVASGTPDVMVIPSLQCADTTTLLILTSLGPNQTTAPTIAVTGTSIAHPVVNSSLGALAPGQLQVAGSRLLLTFDGQHWVLLAPAVAVSPGNAHINIDSFIPDAAPFPQTTEDINNAAFASVLGSSAVPSTGFDATAVFQRNGSVVGAFAPWGPALIASATPSSAHNAHASSLVASLVDKLGWDGIGAPPFDQAAISVCSLMAPGTNGTCGGQIGEVNVWTPWISAVGFEADVNNYSGINPTTTYNRYGNSVMVGYITSCGDHGPLTGSSKCFASFMHNPLSQEYTHKAFYVPPDDTVLACRDAGGSPINCRNVDYSSFESEAQNAPYGLKLDGGHFSIASINAPNYRLSQSGTIFHGGHEQIENTFGLPAPTISGFGTSPVFAGNDAVGRLTVGTGGSSSGTITFTFAYTGQFPVCFAQNETAGTHLQAIASLTSLTITGAMGAGNDVSYRCTGFD